MFYKTTTKLFHGTYQYKIVLICAGASFFRNSDLDFALAELSKINTNTIPTLPYSRYQNKIRTATELDYALKLHSKLDSMSDFELRIESPWISIYSNNNADIEGLKNLNPDNVKYISAPPKTNVLATNSIIMPKMDYDYRVTVGKTSQEYSTFISWAEQNKNLKLTKSCKRDLEKHRSWGGTYFYVTGDNNLLLAKMHLGGCISKVERIVKA